MHFSARAFESLLHLACIKDSNESLAEENALSMRTRGASNTVTAAFCVPSHPLMVTGVFSTTARSTTRLHNGQVDFSTNVRSV